MSKYKITKERSDCVVDFYGAKVGDVIELEDKNDSYIWAKGSDVFTEDGWTGLNAYCVAANMEDFLTSAEEIV